MARDRIFSQRRRRRPLPLGWLFLLALVPLVLFFHPRAGRSAAPSDPTRPVEAVIDVSIPSRSVPPVPSLTAPSYILVDADTGTILAEKNPHARREMASTTKMMTAILTLEHARLDDVVTTSKYASQTNSSGLYLKEGEKVTVRDLLWGLMLRSANDTCVALGEHIAGSEAKFVEMMNAQAAAWGLKDTHYMNPHGLHAEGHYSSAYDLAQIARKGMAIPTFAEMAGRKVKKIERSIEKQDEVVVNKNRLLFRWKLCDGVKTGYTHQAGKCLVASASKDGWRLIAVVLHSGDSWGECRQLLEYGMANYQRTVVAAKGTKVAPVQVLNGRTTKVQAMLDKDVAVVAPRGVMVSKHERTTAGRLKAPIAAGAEMGTLEVRRGDKVLEAVPLVADAAVEEAPHLSSSHLFGVLSALSGLLLLTAVARYGRKAAQASGRRRRRVSSRG